MTMMAKAVSITSLSQGMWTHQRSFLIGLESQVRTNSPGGSVVQRFMRTYYVRCKCRRGPGRSIRIVLGKLSKRNDVIGYVHCFGEEQSVVGEFRGYFGRFVIA